MRREQLAVRLAGVKFSMFWICLSVTILPLPLAICATAGNSPLRFRGTDPSHFDQPGDNPLDQARRIAVVLPEGPADPVVLSIVAEERSIVTRRRPSLFSPKSQPPPKGAIGSKPSKSKSELKSSYSAAQIRSICESLFLDALHTRMSSRLTMQIIPQSETDAALKELRISRTSYPAEATAALCRRLNCDAVIVPVVKNVRTQETTERRLSLWASVRILRHGQDGAAAERDRIQGLTDLHFETAGGSYSGRALLQERFSKDWPQLCLEAARQAANIASRSLVTGVVPPLVHEHDRVAVFPVIAPHQADALVFGPHGRIMTPNAVQLPGHDISPYFHPRLPPTFPEEVVDTKAVASRLAMERRAPESLWNRNESPDSVAVAALGKRLGVQYVLMARISDLEMSLTAQDSRSAGKAEAPVKRTVASQDEDTAPAESASAEAIGALVRVSDAALLWNHRTSATWQGRNRGAQDAAGRKRTAESAIRFALAQLDHRFQIYRRRFE